MEIEKTLESRRALSGKLLNVRVDRVSLPGGGEAVREIVDHPGGVALVAVDDARRVLLVRQYRYAVKDHLVELPAGTRDPGEMPEASAARELEEETGYRASRLDLLTRFYPTPGYTTEDIYVFLATGLAAGQARPEADERLDVMLVPFDQALDMLAQGRILDGKTIVGLLLARDRLRSA